MDKPRFGRIDVVTIVSYITIPDAIGLVIAELSEYNRTSAKDDLRVTAEEIDLELTVVFSSVTESKRAEVSNVRPLVSVVGDAKDAGSQGATTSSHRLTLKLRPLTRDGRELKISTGEIVGSWR